MDWNVEREARMDHQGRGRHAVNNSGARLVVLFLGDPHGLECGEGGQDGATDPDGVFALRGRNDLDLDGGRSKSSDFLLHTISNTGVHGGATRQHVVGEEILTDVNVAPHDGVVDGLVDSDRFHTQEGRLEEGLGGTETLVSDGDDLTVGKLVRLVDGRRGSSGVHFSFKVKSNVAKLLLDVANDFTLSGGGEGVATLSHDLHEVGGQIATSQVQAEDGVGKGVPFVDGDGVGNTISRVQDDTSGTTGGVQGEDSLNGDVHSGSSEGLEHDLGHLLPVGLGVQGSLSQENWRFLRGHTELVVEGVVPDLLHIIPVGDDTGFNGVLEGEDTSLALSLIPDVGILLPHTDHDTLVTGAADDGGEHSSGGVVSGEPGLHHAGAIVHQGGAVVVTHIGVASSTCDL